jgi:7,8-dihydropterin-6-yl-methyl-4-(beta-D-ribofuranosyl)aminobenzene 5'-phosphate synthase
MNVTLTTLCENTAGEPGFMAEWGLSILVQAGGVNVLFDTGRDFAAVQNADKLGVNLRAVDKIVLSHAHADHTGGLREVLRRTGEVDVVAHPGIWDLKYKRRSAEEKAEYNGIPFAREELEKFARFNLTKEPIYISENILTTGEVPVTTDFETIEPHFYLKQMGTFQHDPFADDLALILKTEKGLVVILGCAHRGMINTLRHARILTGDERVYAVIGGTHLYPKTDEQIGKTIESLKEIGVKRIGVSHCTGFHASMRLAQAFGDAFFQNNAGTTYTLDSS